MLSQLPNGVRVIAAPLKERRSVAIGLWVHIGGRDEEPRMSGVSHFLEHIVFKGTSKRSADQIKEAVEGVGGSLNAFTSEEYTCFLAKAPARHFEEVFDVLSDMVQGAALKEADIKKERAVILEEIKMTQDQPSQLVEEHLAELLWPNHGLGRPLAGTPNTVGSLTREQMKNYRDSYYEPGLITVVAAGAIDAKTLWKVAGSRLGLAKKKNLKETQPFNPAQTQPSSKIFSKKTEQTHLALGLHTFAKDHPDVYVLDILNVLLGGNMSSRLFNEVREKRGLAYEISSSVRKFHETGAFVISAGVGSERTEEAIRVILDELKKMAKESTKEDELKRAKEFYLGQLDLSLESTMNQMLWAGENAVCLGRLISQEEVAAHVEKVTAEDLKRVSKKLFLTKPFSLSVVGPVNSNAERSLMRLTDSMNRA